MVSSPWPRRQGSNRREQPPVVAAGVGSRPLARRGCSCGGRRCRLPSPYAAARLQLWGTGSGCWPWSRSAGSVLRLLAWAFVCSLEGVAAVVHVVPLRRRKGRDKEWRKKDFVSKKTKKTNNWVPCVNGKKKKKHQKRLAHGDDLLLMSLNQTQNGSIPSHLNRYRKWSRPVLEIRDGILPLHLNSQPNAT